MENRLQNDSMLAELFKRLADNPDFLIHNVPREVRDLIDSFDPNALFNAVLYGLTRLCETHYPENFLENFINEAAHEVKRLWELRTGGILNDDEIAQLTMNTWEAFWQKDPSGTSLIKAIAEGRK